MDNQKQPRIQPVANIVREQPINPAEDREQTPNSKRQSSLDQRIQNIQTVAKRTKTSIQSLFKSVKTNPITRQPINQKPICEDLEKPSISQTTNNEHPASLAPALQPPRKSTISFIERIQAHHTNHEKPEYHKVATIPCGQNKHKLIPIYRFTDEKRAYEAVEELGKNQYKFGGRLVRYFPTVGNMPNKAKFRNEYQKQIWIHMLEAIGTYNLYTLLGKVDEEENVIIQNINQPIEIYLTGLREIS